MSDKIKYLKKSYILEMIIVPLVTVYILVSPFINASSSPTSNEIGILLMSSIFLLMITFVTVLIAYLAMNELSNYNENKKLVLNIINLIFILTGDVWFLGVFQAILLFLIYKEK
ncbi:hypothetical protein O8C74_08580 [Aliarcobacter butzleri]|uniref:hypothetical protein n=1 Tax=Aliarcobacter butzleri TaxID=28197 RepID=UPI00263E66CD|nr:hypothetical protein [Aliarcobacter butzleri]MDN5087125.1 hypothetical protein [Aliarcobacter butzleri]